MLTYVYIGSVGPFENVNKKKQILCEFFTFSLFYIWILANFSRISQWKQKSIEKYQNYKIDFTVFYILQNGEGYEMFFIVIK